MVQLHAARRNSTVARSLPKDQLEEKAVLHVNIAGSK